MVNMYGKEKDYKTADKMVKRFDKSLFKAKDLPFLSEVLEMLDLSGVQYELIGQVRESLYRKHEEVLFEYKPELSIRNDPTQEVSHMLRDEIQQHIRQYDKIEIKVGKRAASEEYQNISNLIKNLQNDSTVLQSKISYVEKPLNLQDVFHPMFGLIDEIMPSQPDKIISIEHKDPNTTIDLIFEGYHF